MTPDEYLRRVGFSLNDLPWSMRRDLLAELRGHLDELPPETGLEARLGSPEEYAADLRSAAGLDRRRGPIAFLRARRPRNVILAAVALTVIGLATGAVVWIDSYQPLAYGMAGIDPDQALQAPAGDSESVVFHEGRPFRFGITVRNTGSFTVRVVGVPELRGLPISGHVMMSSQPENHGGIYPPFTSFRPFDLKPGDIRVLFVQGVYHARVQCGPGSTGDILSAFPVRFSFLWRNATAWIALPERLAIITKNRPCR